VFKELHPAAWTTPVAIGLFVLTFGVFCLIVWRVLRMPRRQADHAACLPLDDSRETPTPHSHES
jgi:cbb3-type cytochrome oxidase subunit 3